MKSLSYSRGYLAVSIALIYVCFQMLPDAPAARWAAIGLCLLYVAGLGAVFKLSSLRAVSLIFALLYGAALAYGFFFKDPISLLFILQGFLTSFIALKLPDWLSALEAGTFLMITFVLLVYDRDYTWMSLLRQELFIHIGLYALLRMVRINRGRDIERMEHEEEQRRNAEKLTVVHAELAQTHDQLRLAHEELERATLQSLRYAVLEERSRIARDIHDSIGHRLTSVIVQLQALPYVLKNDEAKSAEIVKNVLGVARSCLQEVRTVVHNMGVDETGAGAVSLRSLVQQTTSSFDLDITLDLDESEDQDTWPLDTTVVLYRCLQEALTNTIRHAQATRVEVSIKRSGEEIMLHYRDDGELASGSDLHEGFGLNSIRKRCAEAGGRCEIGAQEPHGFGMNICLPLAALKENETYG